MLMRKFLLVLNCRIIYLHRGQLLLILALATVVTEMKVIEDHFFSQEHNCSFQRIFVEVAEDFAILLFQLGNSASI